MQILNVAAGRSDTERQEAEEKRREHLRAESSNAATFFFWAAGLSALGNGLIPIQVFVIVNIGLIDLLRFYGGSLDRFLPLAVYGASLAWVLILVGLGYAARTGRRMKAWFRRSRISGATGVLQSRPHTSAPV